MGDAAGNLSVLCGMNIIASMVVNIDVTDLRN